MKRRKKILIGCGGIFLLLVGLIAIAVVLVTLAPTEFVNAQAALDNRLVIPPQLMSRLENGEKVFNLTVQQGTTEFMPGQRTSTLGFNGAYLGPTLRAHTGDKVRINITNSLSDITTVHWHGMHLPAAMDGGPYQLIAPGAIWQPTWTVTNQAATLWYHPHELGQTAEQVYRGLAGLFIIDDANSDGLNLPHEYGVDDIPLVVQDRKFDSAGQFVYQKSGSTGNLPAPAGMLGDTILVNGTRAPYLEVPQKLIRLRLVNGSDGRRYDFGFADHHAFTQIATDGGLLDAPVERTDLLLAPGERTEILVDLTGATGPLTLMSYPIDDHKGVTLNFASGIFGKDDEHQQFKILELRPQAGTFAAQTVPAKLNNIQRLVAAEATTTRRFALDSWTINDKAMDHTRVDAVVKKGDTEIWEIQNQSAFYHPFHIHGVQFLLLARDNQAVPAYEAGWKDTVIVHPTETVRLIMQFTDYADPHTPYMFHCHILEHEDKGMMGQFVVVDNLSDPVSLPATLDGHEQH